MITISEFVQWAGGASALIAALSWAAKQGMEAIGLLAQARAAREQAAAAKITAEAAQDVAGAKALEDALERVDRLEERVAELEREREEKDDRIRHLEGQQAVQQQQLDAERRAREAAEGRESALARELAELRLAITGGHQGLPTPMLPPKR